MTGGTIEMGVIETIKRQEREKGIKTGIEKGIKTGIEKGIEQGVEKGKREEAIAIALEFKKMGLPIADIAKGTGLSIEEIEKL